MDFLDQVEAAVENLNGYDVNQTAELLGNVSNAVKKALASGDQKKKEQAIRVTQKITQKKANDRAVQLDADKFRGQFLRRMGMLPGDIRNGLDQKRLQIVKVNYYSTVDASGKSNIQLFEKDKPLAAGVRNINQAQLHDADRHFLLCAIQIRVGTASEAVSISNFATLASATTFGSIVSNAQLSNGELTLRVNSKPILQERDGMAAFATTSAMNQIPGYLEVEPKFIEPKKVMEGIIDTGAPLDARTLIRIDLYGAAVMPA